MSLLTTAIVTADPSDPFSRENRAKPKLSKPSVFLGKIVDFSVTADPPKAKPGEIVRLTITGKPKPGYYTYPLTKLATGQAVGKLSRLSYEGHLELQPLWPVTESQPQFVINDLKDIELEHKKEFTWSQDFYVSPDAKPGVKQFDVFIRLQVCDKGGCFGPDLYPPFEATIEVMPGSPVAPTKEVSVRLEAKQPDVIVEAPPADLVAAATAAKTAAPSKATASKNDAPGKADTRKDAGTSDPRKDFWGLMGAAFVGAFLMLLTPCVFPMIPITVNFFLKQSEKEHHNPLLMASVYSGTIIFLLTIVMLALGSVVIELANDPWFNLILGCVLILFALSLFGMFELDISFLARFTSRQEGQGGMIGAIFMAMTFTITSFTCTGPFLGVMLAPVAGIQPPLLHLVLAALVYSTTFAAPFFFLALFPSILKTLPKSGSWLNSIKVTMGFLELGAALKFLSNTDYALFPGDPRLFTYDAVLCAWIALSFACGLYLIGVFRLPHDDPTEHIGALRMMIATIFFGLTIYLTPALYGSRLRGVVGENVMAFLPPRVGETSGFAAAGHGLSWPLHYEKVWQEAKAENKLIFMDFTGVNCVNCRYNEESIFSRPEVTAELKKYARVSLYTDNVPDRTLSAAQAKELADRHARWRDTLADPTNPTYVIFKPDPDQPFDEEGNPKGTKIDVDKGRIFSVDNFLTFLREPLKNHVAVSPRPASTEQVTARVE
jgi:thiol:disulfide interchange protein DsbD